MKQPNKTRAPDLKKHSFKKGLCLKIFIRKPKKPNSALRKVARVKLSTKKEVTAYITKQGNNLQEYSIEGLVQIYLFKNLNSYVWP